VNRFCSSPILLCGLFLLSFYFQGVYPQLSCINENGASVDWWVIYKLPGGDNPLSQDGLGYAFIDSYTQELQITGRKLDSTGALGRTLALFYGSQSGYYLWNDVTPDGKTDVTKGISKGILAFSDTGGFFIRHSVPGFPNYYSQGQTGLPAAEIANGHVFACLSISIGGVSSITGQALINGPNVYDFFIPDSEIIKQFPNITLLSKGNWIQQVYAFVSLQTRSGNFRWSDYSKSKICPCYLWDTVIPNRNVGDFYVLAYGYPLLPKNCHENNMPFDIMNVQAVTWRSMGQQFTYNNDKDQAKWGINLRSGLVCIGDHPRVASSQQRGGGAMCIQNPGLLQGFQSILQTVDVCPPNK